MIKNKSSIITALLIFLGTTATIHSEWVWVEGRRVWRDPVDVVGNVVGNVVGGALDAAFDRDRYHYRYRRGRRVYPYNRGYRRGYYGRRGW